MGVAIPVERVRSVREAPRVRGLDARGVFAARVAESLEGGRAAVLRPARRRRLIRIARMLGIREFDAHLLIALAQDRARRGEALTDGIEGVGVASGRIAIGGDHAGMALMLAVALGGLGFCALRAWVGI